MYDTFSFWTSHLFSTLKPKCLDFNLPFSSIFLKDLASFVCQDDAHVRIFGNLNFYWEKNTQNGKKDPKLGIQKWANFLGNFFKTKSSEPHVYIAAIISNDIVT